MVQCGRDCFEPSSGSQLSGVYSTCRKRATLTMCWNAGSIQGHGQGFAMEGAVQSTSFHPGSGSYTWWGKLDEASYTYVGVAKTSDSVRLYDLGK